MKHAIDIENYNGTLKDLSEDVGDLHYLRLKDFFILLSSKIKKDAKKDKLRGRKKLSKELNILSKDILYLSNNIDRIWKVCKKYMNNINIQFLYNEDEKTKAKIVNDVYNIYNELKDIFNDDLEYVNIRIHNSRKKFNKYLGMDTKAWLIGNVNDKQEIDLISPNLIEKEKYHNKEEFYSLLKHELIHLFINKKTNYKNIPMWLNEGISEYLSQEKVDIQNIFIPEDFFCKNITMEDWHNSIDKDIKAYQISKYFIDFLLDSFKFDDLISLLKSLDKKYTKKMFLDKFKIVFKKDFDEIVKKFLKIHL